MNMKSEQFGLGYDDGNSDAKSGLPGKEPTVGQLAHYGEAYWDGYDQGYDDGFEDTHAESTE